MRKLFLRLITISLLTILFSCGKGGAIAPKRVERFALGTVCQITFYTDVDENTIEDCFDEIQKIESLLSRTIESSELSRINRGEIDTLSSESEKILRLSLDYAELTGGLFNPAIGPLVDLWKIGTPEARLPSEGEINETLGALDWSQIGLDGRKITIDRDMSIDLGGIAKGYAADRVGEILLSKGIKSAIINLGGNVLVLGTKPNGDLWKIGLQNPTSERGTYVGILKIEAMSMVTSGNYERFFEQEGVRYHHIFDSRTGYPVENNLASVTIVTPKSVDGDALSTSLYVMGLEKGFKFASETSLFEAIFITKEGEIYLTPGIGDSFSLTDSSFTVSTLPQ